MYVNSVSDVVATEGDIDADLGAELPAQRDGDVGLDSTMAVSLPLHGHADEQSAWPRNAWTLELQTQPAEQRQELYGDVGVRAVAEVAQSGDGEALGDRETRSTGSVKQIIARMLSKYAVLNSFVSKVKYLLNFTFCVIIIWLLENFQEMLRKRSVITLSFMTIAFDCGKFE